MKSFHRAATTVSFMMVLLAPGFAQTVRPPPQSEWDRATADLTGTDAAARDAAVEKVKVWINGGWVSQDLWRKWFPALAKLNTPAVNQQIADLALLGMIHRPEPLAIVPLAEFRFKALFALNKPGKEATDQLLAAAKSYYNVCDIKYTANAVTLVSQALAKARPDDPEIVRKFRAEQAAASAASAATQGSPLKTQDSILSTVTIDPAPYAATLAATAGRTKFADRVGHGNLLLAADKGAEAEQEFRELFILAASQEELTTATEGVAKSLRAQDGNVGRANGYLLAMQQKNATQPSGLPSAPPKPTTRPAGSALP